MTSSIVCDEKGTNPLKQLNLTPNEDCQSYAVKKSPEVGSSLLTSTVFKFFTEITEFQKKNQ